MSFAQPLREKYALLSKCGEFHFKCLLNIFEVPPNLATILLKAPKERRGGLGSAQSCKKITILDRKDQDPFIDLNLLHDLDQFIDLLKLILIFDL